MPASPSKSSRGWNFSKDKHPCINAGDGTIPAYGLVTVVGLDPDGFTLQVDQPSADSQHVWILQSPIDVQPGGRSFICRAFPLWVTYDPASGTPANGEVWGAAKGSYLLTAGQNGFLILGDPNETQGLVLVNGDDGDNSGSGTTNYYDETLNLYDSTVDITDVNFNILPPGPYNGGWDCPACWSGYPLTWLAQLLFPAAWAPFNNSFRLTHQSGCTWTLGTPGSAIYLSLSYDPTSTTWFLIGQAGAKFFSYKTSGPQDCSANLSLALVTPNDPTLPTTIILQVGTPWIPRARFPVTWRQPWPGTALISQPPHTICDCPACPSGYPPTWLVSLNFRAALGDTWLNFNGEWTLLYLGNCTWTGLSPLPAAQGLVVTLSYAPVSNRWNLVGQAPDGTSFTYSSNSTIYGGYGWLCCPREKNRLFFQAASGLPAKYVWPGVAVQDQLNAPPQSLDVKPGQPCVPCRATGKCDCPACPGGYPTAWSVVINFPAALGANWTAFNKTWVLDQYTVPCFWSNAAPGAQNAQVVTLFFDAGAATPGWRLQGFSLAGVAFSYFLGGGQQGQAGWDCCAANTLNYDTANGVPAGQNLQALVPTLTAQPASDCLNCKPQPHRKIAFQKHQDPVVIGDGGDCDCAPCGQGVPSTWQVVLDYLPDYDDASLAEISGEWILSYQGKCTWSSYATAITQDLTLPPPAAPLVTLTYDASNAQFVLTAFTSAGLHITYITPAANWSCCNANWMPFANSTISIAIPANKGGVLLSVDTPCSPCGANPVRPGLRLGAKMVLASACGENPADDPTAPDGSWQRVSERPVSLLNAPPGAVLRGMVPTGGVLGEPDGTGAIQIVANVNGNGPFVINHEDAGILPANQFHSVFAQNINLNPDQLAIVVRDDCSLGKHRAYPLGFVGVHLVGDQPVIDADAVQTEGAYQGLQQIVAFADTTAGPSNLTAQNRWQGWYSAMIWGVKDVVSKRWVRTTGWPAISVLHNGGQVGHPQPSIDLIDNCGGIDGVEFVEVQSDDDANTTHVKAQGCPCAADGSDDILGPSIVVDQGGTVNASTCTYTPDCVTYQFVFDCKGRYKRTDVTAGGC